MLIHILTHISQIHKQYVIIAIRVWQQKIVLGLYMLYKETMK